MCEVPQALRIHPSAVDESLQNIVFKGSHFKLDIIVFARLFSMKNESREQRAWGIVNSLIGAIRLLAFTNWILTPFGVCVLNLTHSVYTRVLASENTCREVLFLFSRCIFSQNFTWIFVNKFISYIQLAKCFFTLSASSSSHFIFWIEVSCRFCLSIKVTGAVNPIGSKI